MPRTYTSRREHGERYIQETTGYAYLVLRVDGRTIHRGEHRVVMETILGRPLRRGETVHHKNGNKTDNRPANLELWVGAIRYGQRAIDLLCPHCGRGYI